MTGEKLWKMVILREPRFSGERTAGLGSVEMLYLSVTGLEPIVALAENFRLSARELKELQGVIERRRDEILSAWNKHFKR